jgi:hypothetical protein
MRSKGQQSTRERLNKVKPSVDRARAIVSGVFGIIAGASVNFTMFVFSPLSLPAYACLRLFASQVVRYGPHDRFRSWWQPACRWSHVP